MGVRVSTLGPIEWVGERVVLGGTKKIVERNGSNNFQSYFFKNWTHILSFWKFWGMNKVDRDGVGNNNNAGRKKDMMEGEWWW